MPVAAGPRRERRLRAARFAALASLFGAWGWFVAGGRFNDYVATFFFFRWHDDGLVKRGLVGTLLDVVSFPLDPTSLTLLAGAGVVAVGILLFRFIERSLADADSSHAAGYQFLFATSPAVFQQSGYDLGRLDGLGILLLLLALPLVRGSRPARDKLLAVAVCSAGLLVHEAFFFMQLPVLLGVALVEGTREGGHGRWLPAALLVTATATLMLVLAAGSSTHAAATATDRAVAQGYDPYLADMASEVLHQTTDAGKVRAWLSGRKNQAFFVLTFGFFVLHAVIYLRRARRLLTRAEARGDRRWAATALMLSPFGVLPLYAIGIDYHRWAACGIFNVLLVAVIIEGRYGDRSERGWIARAPRRWLAGIAAGSAALGPVGAHYAFPLVVQVLVYLKDAWPPLDHLIRAIFGDRQFFEVQQGEGPI
jgi:hypothetical protein